MALRSKVDYSVNLLTLQNITDKAGTHDISLRIKGYTRYLPLQTCSSVCFRLP